MTSDIMYLVLQNDAPLALYPSDAFAEAEKHRQQVHDPDAQRHQCATFGRLIRLDVRREAPRA